MVSRADLTAFLDELLIRSVSCTDSSNNGLQVEGRDRVERVAFGVDGCVDLFERAAAAGAGYVVVHHGLSWRDSLKYLTNVNAARVRTLFANDLSLYAAHLPLDMHPEVGHNARICGCIGLKNLESCFEYGDALIGYAGDLPRPIASTEFVRLVDRVLDTESILWPFGPDTLHRIGVVSGGGADGIEACLDARVDCLLTGEAGHQYWHVARECGVNVVVAGHYKTEVPGLLAVMARVQEHFDIPCEFIDLPTGL